MELVKRRLKRNSRKIKASEEGKLQWLDIEKELEYIAYYIETKKKESFVEEEKHKEKKE